MRAQLLRTLWFWSGLLAMVGVAACGNNSGNGAREEIPDQEAVASPSPETAGAAEMEPLALTPDDLGAYERGLTREIEAVRAAKEQSSVATSPQERSQALMASLPEQTSVEGAQSAGVSLEHYRRVRERLNEILRTLSLQGAFEGPVSVDTTLLSPEARTQFRQQMASDPYAALPPATAAALRERLGRLGALWAEYTELTAVGG